MAVVSDKIDQIMPHCVLTSIMRICHEHCTNTLGFQNSEEICQFENNIIKTKLCVKLHFLAKFFYCTHLSVDTSSMETVQIY